MINSRGGRNAGLVIQDRIYRIGQETGYGGVYGKSVVVHRIDELSATTYKEKSIQSFSTGFNPATFRKTLRASHLHTLNENSSHTVFDFIPV